MEKKIRNYHQVEITRIEYGRLAEEMRGEGVGKNWKEKKKTERLVFKWKW